MESITWPVLALLSTALAYDFDGTYTSDTVFGRILMVGAPLGGMALVFILIVGISNNFGEIVEFIARFIIFGGLAVFAIYLIWFIVAGG